MAPVTLGKINVDIFKSFEQEFNYMQCLIQGNCFWNITEGNSIVDVSNYVTCI